MSTTPIEGQIHGGGEHHGFGHGHGIAGYHPVRKVKHYLLPDGRKVHIAQSPEEAEHLRRRLSSIKPQEEFDLLLHGSPEHLDVLRQVQSHRRQRQDDLRQQHGSIYDEIDNVQRDLEALSVELHNLTDHDVNLDANFSKYGYSAHLRTKDNAESPPSHSGHTTPGDHTPHSKKDWNEELYNANVVTVWKRPVVRQYFHKGLLWRSSQKEEVMSFELFVDLLFVGIIAINGDKASENPTGLSLLRFSITFILSWKLWSDLTLVVSWFESDDIFQRLAVLFDMACLFGLTTNIVEAFDHTYSQLIAFYLAARFFAAIYYIEISILVPMVKAFMIANAVIVLVPCALWIGTIYVAEPQREALIWVALFIDIFGSTLIIFLVRGFRRVNKRWHERINGLFDFFPAVNIEHRTERTNAFVTLVFGYAVVALLYQNKAPLGLNAFFGKAILGLVQAFAFNWIYFEIDGTNLFQHAIRRAVWSSIVWVGVHLPFIMSFVLSAAALSKLVIAHDCHNADPDSLSDTYIPKSEAEISQGLRWFYCAGLGLALASMAVISMTHIHKEIANQRVKKRHRLTVRFAVSIIIVALGAADSLDSLRLIGITCSLVVFSLVMDLYGSSCAGASLFGPRKKCRYMADCKLKRKDLENAVEKGLRFDLEQLAEQHKGEKGMMELS